MRRRAARPSLRSDPSRGFARMVGSLPGYLALVDGLGRIHFYTIYISCTLIMHLDDAL